LTLKDAKERLGGSKTVAPVVDAKASNEEE